MNVLFTTVFFSLTGVSITWGYVCCQDLKKSFDSPDQLLMVIRAPPETQMQVSEPSKVRRANGLRLCDAFRVHFVAFSPVCPHPF